MTDVVVDIGNARIKWAAVTTDGAAAPSRFAVHAGDETAAAAGIAATVAAFPGDTERVLVANVAGREIETRLDTEIRARFGYAPRYLRTSAEELGVRCGYRDPARLGVDRWAAVIAAYHFAAGPDGAYRPACVINAGTALTLDAVDAGGQHLGGLIMAGARLAAEALERRTRRIGSTPTASAKPAGLALLGRSTDEAVGHAAWLGPAAAFDRAIRVVADALNQVPVVFVAGGDAAHFASWLETDVRLRADFVLEGLALIVNRWRATT
jgi:type III pantothenate kinase